MFLLRIKTGVLLIVLAVSSIHCNTTCSDREISSSYLDAALDLIWKAKGCMPDNCLRSSSNIKHEEKIVVTGRPKDCTELLEMGHNITGIYTIYPVSRVTENKAVDVYCDMDTNGGGWTAIQRRGLQFQREKEYFVKNWQSYKEGFGDVEKEFWLGNDNIYALTNQIVMSVRFDLKAADQSTKFALYDTFWIDDEDHNYTLHIADYSGDAGDSMIEVHDNMKFSTIDRKNDNRKDGEDCAEMFKGGWWYNECHSANLNGLLHKGKHESFADGVNWKTWKGFHESLKWSEVKVRPRSFRANYASKANGN